MQGNEPFPSATPIEGSQTPLITSATLANHRLKSLPPPVNAIVRQRPLSNCGGHFIETADASVAFEQVTTCGPNENKTFCGTLSPEH